MLVGSAACRLLGVFEHPASWRTTPGRGEEAEEAEERGK